MKRFCNKFWRGQKNSGFTLMELLIVMVILAVLVGLVSGTFTSSTKRGRDSRRKSDLKNLSTALEAYNSDKGSYPSSNGSGQIVGCGVGDAQVCSWGGEFRDQYNTLYMVQIPSDPSAAYKYYYTSTGSTYKVYAKMENTQDVGSGVKQSGYTSTNCALSGSTLCTFGVASSNTSL